MNPSNSLTVAEVLEKAADLIEPEGAWTQGVFARRADDRPTDPRGADAKCFCIRGALLAVAPRPLDAVRAEMVAAKSIVLDDDIGDLVRWNDSPKRKQAEVVHALRTAAAKARQQEKI